MDLLVFVYIYMFILGCCIASFINVLIYRIPQKLDFVRGRSFCPKCHNTLKAYDLVPIFSWLFLKGKCRYCQEPISIRYPLIELCGGIIAMICFYRYEFSWMTLVSFGLAMILLTITMIDFDTMTIPDGLVVALIVPALACTVLNQDISIVSRVIGMLCVSGFMFVLTLIIPDCFGGGDMKLMFVCGFMLGWVNTLLAGFIALLVGGIYASYLLISRKTEESHMAFGPYLCLGVFIALLYGNEIIGIYLSLFNL